VRTAQLPEPPVQLTEQQQQQQQQHSQDLQPGPE